MYHFNYKEIQCINGVFDSLLNLYNTNYEVKDTIQSIGLTIAFLCIPELIGNHDSIESLLRLSL